MIVHLSAEAEHDLDVIGEWIAGDNASRAVSFIRELRDACLGLAEFPDRFPIVPRYDQRGVRHRVHGNYLIFYRIEADKVVVIRVLHGAMEYADLLFPTKPR